MSADYDELMERVQKQLNAFPIGKKRRIEETDSSTYVRTIDPDFDNPNAPVRQMYFMHFYVHDLFEGNWWEMQHDFTDLPNIDAPVENLVIHGHSSDMVCATPHFCHHALFDINTSRNEVFKGLFKVFWKAHYAFPSPEIEVQEDDEEASCDICNGTGIDYIGRKCRRCNDEE